MPAQPLAPSARGLQNTDSMCALCNAKAAQRIENAVKKVLAQGYRTGDIYERGTNKVGTKEMGDAVLAALA